MKDVLTTDRSGMYVFIILALRPQTGSVQLLCTLLFSIPGATTDDFSQARIWDRAGLQIQRLHVCGMFILKPT